MKIEDAIRAAAFDAAAQIHRQLLLCRCPGAVITVARDRRGVLVDTQYTHTDEACPVVVASVASEVERAFGVAGGGDVPAPGEGDMGPGGGT